jgi:hypothetical protein
MPSFLGCAQTLTAIPSLLISDLQRVQDPVVQRALLQIQDHANSIAMVSGVTGTGTAAFGTGNCPAVFPNNPTTWVKVCHQGNMGYIPVWV